MGKSAEQLAAEEARDEAILAQSEGSEIEFQNEKLEEFVEFYDCADLLPFAMHIVYLYNVKEALGSIPPSFDLSHQEISALVMLQSEYSMKSQKDMLESKLEGERNAAAAKRKAGSAKRYNPRRAPVSRRRRF